jgi:class 3 adenylate cyclase
VQIALAAGDREAAEAAAEELTAIAEQYGSDALRAAAHTARSRIALDRGEVRPAIRNAREALRLWQQVGAPYEGAQARMALALAYLAEGNADSGALELQAAASTFDHLGAVPDARVAREQLSSLGLDGLSRGAAEGTQIKTFMFTDMVRSTSLVHAIGDDAWAELVRWHDDTLRSLFVEHGGEEIDHAGDGFFVAFANPVGAVECAVAVQRRLFEHRRAHGFAPEVRIGLHKAQATRRGSAYRGKGVHEAARISALAEGGEILASAQTLAGAELRFPASDGRSVELKGIPEPVELLSIDWRT